MLPIKKQILRYNNPKTLIRPIGIVIHETANPGDSAQGEFNYFNSGNRSASAHAFIDTKEIVQCIEWTNKAWHGGPTANNRFIGIEMCHATNQIDFSIIYQQTVELFAYLFVNVLNILNVSRSNLMSHAEVSNTWNETDHLDPIDYFAQYGKTVDGFRQDVQKAIEPMLFKKAVDKLVSKKIISSPDYWLNNAVSGGTVLGEYAGIILQRCTNKTNLSDALTVIINKGLTNSAQYWTTNAIKGGTVNGLYMRAMIIRLANII